MYRMELRKTYFYSLCIGILDGLNHLPSAKLPIRRPPLVVHNLPSICSSFAACRQQPAVNSLLPATAFALAVRRPTRGGSGRIIVAA
jgi:hypothetical protein